jgi:hypothetical protein
MVARARIVSPRQVGVTPTGTEIPIISGDVTVDINADVNATLRLETEFSWPSSSTSLGTPYGQEIYVERGIEYGDGGTEWVGLGYFRIEDVEQDHVPNGSIHITASDRMASIKDARPLKPTQFGTTASFQAVVDYVLNEALPGVPAVYDFAASTTILGISHIMDQDRLKFLSDLVTAYGKIMYFDYAGRLQIKDAPDPTKAAVYTVNAGRNGVMVSMKRALSRDGVYNAVVATGEAAGENPPVRGVAYDDNPSSPTYFSGDFGPVPKFFSSTFLQTNDQCVTAARAELRKSTGLPYSVSLGTIVNPALEAGDVLSVSYSEKAVAETHIADKIVYPLDARSPMTIETRKQYLT